jgi:hypothetical protein
MIIPAWAPGTLSGAAASTAAGRHSPVYRRQARTSRGGTAAADAHDQYAPLLPVSERVFGPEHPTIPAARANLAAWTEATRQGRWYSRN